MEKIYLDIEKKIEVTMSFENKMENYFTFKIFIKSNLFSGRNIFSLSKENLIQYIKSLEKLLLELDGELKIEDLDSDDFINIKFIDKIGHIKVQGQLGGSFNEQYVIFCFYSDQTFLQNLSDFFKKYLYN